MIRKILSTIALLIMMSVASFGQTPPVAGPISGPTLLVDGSINPTQIPDLNAYRSVLVYLQADTAITLAQKIANIQLTNPADAAILSTDVPSFASGYSVQTTRTAADAVVQSTIDSLQTALTPAGAVQLNTYVQQQKKGMKIYAFSSDTSKSITTYGNVAAFEFGDPDSGWDDFGDEEGYAVEGPYTCNAYPQSPSSTFVPTGATASGRVAGLSGWVDQTEGNNNSQGTIYTETFEYHFLLIGNVCSRQILSISLNVQFEIAYTKVLLQTAGYDCVPGSVPSVCTYDTAVWCSAPADFNPTGVSNTHLYSAWLTYGACERFGASGPWACLATLAEGTSNQIKAGLPFGGQSCTYNP
jgi:hypothetical protein